MDVHVIPKLVGRIITQHSVPCHVVAMGQIARDIFPSFALCKPASSQQSGLAGQGSHNQMHWEVYNTKRIVLACACLTLMLSQWSWLGYLAAGCVLPEKVASPKS